MYIFQHMTCFMVVLVSQNCCCNSSYHSHVPGKTRAWVSPASTPPSDTQIRSFPGSPYNTFHPHTIGLYLVTLICKESYEVKFFTGHKIKFLLLRKKEWKALSASFSFLANISLDEPIEGWDDVILTFVIPDPNTIP